MYTKQNDIYLYVSDDLIEETATLEEKNGNLIDDTMRVVFNRFSFCRTAEIFFRGQEMAKAVRPFWSIIDDSELSAVLNKVCVFYYEDELIGSCFLKQVDQGFSMSFYFKKDMTARFVDLIKDGPDKAMNLNSIISFNDDVAIARYYPCNGKKSTIKLDQRDLIIMEGEQAESAAIIGYHANELNDHIDDGEIGEFSWWDVLIGNSFGVKIV